MGESRAQRFIDALHRLEEDREVDPVVELFADDARLSNPAHEEHGTGREGARKFWSAYRDTFAEIHSEFRNTVEVDGTAALEWRSRGRTAEGNEFGYDGVSVLEYDEDGIHAFRAYFDPNELGTRMVRRRGRRA